MENALSNLSGVALVMTSREIAVLTDKQHQHVKRDIEKMLAELGEDASTFGRIYQDSMNREQVEYQLDRVLTDTLLTGYSAIARRKVVARWHELEKAAAFSALPNFMDPVAAARAWAEQVEQKQIATGQRDEAIRTKAQIGSKREASAMATASVAVRKVERLQEELGRNQKHATQIAVERATGREFGKTAYVPLRKVCKEFGLAPVDVADARYGSVKAWPAVAWRKVFDIDLAELFAHQGSPV